MSKGAQITFNCDHCGNEHTQNLSNYKKNNNHFCTLRCASLYSWKKRREELGIDKDEIIECACGCGKTRRRYSKKSRQEYKYIHGHNKERVSSHFSKGHTPYNKGMKMNEESISKQKESFLKYLEKNPISLEKRKRISCTLREIPIEQFDGFTGGKRKAFEERKLHNEWRTNIFKRDNYICRLCGNKGSLRAHHIKSWNDFPSERRNIDNGITLCKECHYFVHTKKYKETKGELIWHVQ